MGWFPLSSRLFIPTVSGTASAAIPPMLDTRGGCPPGSRHEKYFRLAAGLILIGILRRDGQDQGR